MTYTSRNTQAIINLTALKENYQSIDKLAKNSATIAVIKADAYGHGAVEVAKSLEDIVPAFAVAFIDEAIVLRDAGIQAPILILEGALTETDFAFSLQHNFWLMLHNHEQITHLLNQAQPYLGKLWLKIDTGMSRLGFMPEEVSEIMPKVLSCLPAAQQEELVLCSHFSNAEEKLDPKTLKQIQSFETIRSQYNCQASLANSAGIIQWPQSHYNFNRLGIALYGMSPIDELNTNIHNKSNTDISTENMTLSPVMSLQSSIIALRKLAKGDFVGYGENWQATRTSVIATVAIGYADGYPRSAKTGTPVFINNQQVPLVGRVSMDMITVDVTDLVTVNIGDKVELWGENLPVDTIAKQLDTISYELLTRVSPRVPRKYL
jgi:alanine racemase